jgi:hypothetical protein
MLERLATWLIERAQRTPYYHLTGYMRRWWLVPYRSDMGDGTGPVTWRRPVAKLLQAFDVAVRVHEILRSDEGRDFHDHPWSYLTVILRGGYWELTPIYDASGMFKGERRVWHGPGAVLFRRAQSWHHLELPPGATATTLFCTGSWRQHWGFLTAPAHKTYYRDYQGRT